MNKQLVADNIFATQPRVRANVREALRDTWESCGHDLLAVAGVSEMTGEEVGQALLNCGVELRTYGDEAFEFAAENFRHASPVVRRAIVDETFKPTDVFSY